MGLGIATIIKSTPVGLNLLGRAQERDGLIRRVVRPGDDIVIDGFPRSSNSFATNAFIFAQERDDLLIGNHMHSPAQFHLARRYKVPAMLVLRRPEDAVSSLVVYGDANARSGLVRYIRFHESVLPISQSMLIAPFEEVISDFNVSIAKLNEKFDTHFLPFDHTPENAERILEKVHLKVTRRNEVNGTSPVRVPRADARAMVMADGLRPILERAQGVYSKLMAN